MSGINLLMLSKGSFEGNHIISSLFGQNVYGSGSDPVTGQINGSNVTVTNIHINLDGKNSGSVARAVQERIRGVTYDGVLVVLALPVRSTPESQRHLQTIQKIIGTKVLRNNTILLFTNGSYMNRNPKSFQQFLLNEIEASNQDRLREASLGKLIKEAHYPRNKKWANCDFTRCVLYDTDCKDLQEKVEQNDRVLSSVRLLSPFTASNDGPHAMSFGIMGGLVLITSILAITAVQLKTGQGSVPGDNTAHTVEDLRQLLKIQYVEIRTLRDNITMLNDTYINIIQAINNTHIETVTSINETHSVEVNSLNDDIDRLSSINNQLSNTIQNLEATIKNKNEQIAEKDKEIQFLKGESNIYKMKIKNMFRENKRQRSDLKTLRNIFVTQGKAWKKEVKDLKDKINELKPADKEKGYLESIPIIGWYFSSEEEEN